MYREGAVGTPLLARRESPKNPAVYNTYAKDIELFIVMAAWNVVMCVGVKGGGGSALARRAARAVRRCARSVSTNTEIPRVL